MAEFYIKNEAGEFIEADDKVDERFREKSDKIVSERLNKLREKEISKVRDEVEKEVREKTTETIKTEVRGEVEKEFQAKLDEAQAKNKELETKFRRKSIAAEYGFKPETEEFLGNGTEDEMRKKADTLKNSFASDGKFNAPDKETKTISKIKETTGLDIKL